MQKQGKGISEKIPFPCLAFPFVTPAIFPAIFHFRQKKEGAFASKSDHYNQVNFVPSPIICSLPPDANVSLLANQHTKTETRQAS